MSGDEPAEDAASRPARTWPAHARPGPGERVELACDSCGQAWHVHVDLAGYRLQCECGLWLVVPADARRPASLGPIAQLSAGDAVAPWNAASPQTNAEPQLRHAPESVQRRWIDRSMLDLVAMLAALWLPWVVIELAFAGRERVLFMPFAGLFAGLGVLAVGLTARRSTFEGLVPARFPAFVEATGVALFGAALALLYTSWLEGADSASENVLVTMKAELGLSGTIFLIGVIPAVFEELAFRGLVQARVTVLFGRSLGILVAGVAFALAHGITAGFPFHLCLGLHLGWLRARSGSLYPCMLEHFLYNSTLVLLA